MKQNEVIEALLNSALESGAYESDFESLENAVGRSMGVKAAAAFRDRLNQMKFGNPRGNPPAKAFGAYDNKIENGAVAGFTIVVERKTANIAQNLPVPIFGPVDRQAGYSAILGQLLPSGVTVKGMAYGIDSGISKSNILEINYTNGAADDTIVVSCAQNPYPVVLESIRTDLMRMNGVRLSLSNSSLVSQFDQQFNVYKRTLAGRTTSDSLTPNMFKDPQNFQNGIVDVKKQITIDKETTIVTGMINQAFSMSLNFYAGTLDKWTYGNDGPGAR